MIYALGNGLKSEKHEINGVFETVFGSQDLVQCHYTCELCDGPLTSDCNTCAAEDTESLNGYCEVSDLSQLLASKEIISSDFVVSWGYVMEGYIDLMIEILKCDWFGIAFGQRQTYNNYLIILYYIILVCRIQICYCSVIREWLRVHNLN